MTTTIRSLCICFRRYRRIFLYHFCHLVLRLLPWSLSKLLPPASIFSGFSTGEALLLHTGKDPGVSTAALLFPHSGNGYVIFMNGDNNVPVLEQLLPQLYLGAELWQRK